MQIVRYTPDKKAEWNNFVSISKNGTFLLLREYMDYHADRFVDCSLLFYRDGKLQALLPANWLKSERVFYSHQGLTYGGLIMGRELTALRVMEIFSDLINWLRLEMNATGIIYKAIPYIYHQFPAEEDLYALFRQHAVLCTRSISSVLDLSNKLPLRKGRKSSVKQAFARGIEIYEEENFTAFWGILVQLLFDKYNTSPVHSLEEITLLKNRFPEQIRLFAATSCEGELLGGTVVYEFPKLIHSQYIAASPKGKEQGVIDALYAYLISERFADKNYIDFGTSVEQGGWVLNEGLIRQKEGFGARAVMYDVYELSL